MQYRNKMCFILILTIILAVNLSATKINSSASNPNIKVIRYRPLIVNKIEYKHLNIKKHKKYNQKDLDLLSRVIYAEAGDCSDKEQLLVGNVIMNRVESKGKGFPKTIKDVIYQCHPRQYECVANGAINKTPSAKAIKNAKRILEGERFCPKSIVYQSEFRQGKGVYEKIGKTYFCYD